MNPQTEEGNNDQQDSIKVCRNSKGFTWEIKRYYDFSKIAPQEVVRQIQQIDKELQGKFMGGQDE